MASEGQTKPIKQQDLKCENSVYSDREAVSLAIGVSDELLPSAGLIEKIRYDLRRIRTKFPVVLNVKHRSLVEPGEVLAELTDEQLEKLHKSQTYKVKSEKRIGRVFFMPDLRWLRFTLPYNPTQLSRVLQLEFGATFAKASASLYPVGYLGDDIVFDAEENTYTFKKVWGQGKRFARGQRHVWIFKILKGNNNEIVLERESGDTLPEKQIPV